eukprot:m.83232 g.83232  ORF g.83232 m.83232 type:complete len:439 (-) comp14760_c0_seq2:111-1427(-)
MLRGLPQVVPVLVAVNLVMTCVLFMPWKEPRSRHPRSEDDSLSDDLRHTQDTMELMGKRQQQQDSIVHRLETDIARLEKQYNDQGKYLFQIKEKLEQTPGTGHGEVHKGCVVNPSNHWERTGQKRKECPSKHDISDEPTLGFPQRSFVLSLDSASSRKAFEDRRAYLDPQGIALERYMAVNGHQEFGHMYTKQFDAVNNVTITTYTDHSGLKIRTGEPGFLTAGERGYRQSMKRLFQMLLKENSVKTVMVTDDDVVFSCHFATHLRSVLSQPRCGGHLSHQATRGGILLLGAAVWIDGTYPERGPYSAGWRLIKEDISTSKQATGKFPMCFNVNRKTFGSFAVLYHRDTFQTIIDWIDSSSLPFDHIWPIFAKQGTPVRVSFPNIAIQNVMHESSIDASRNGQSDMLKRAKLHKWNLKEYCEPGTHQTMSTFVQDFSL